MEFQTDWTIPGLPWRGGVDHCCSGLSMNSLRFHFQGGAAIPPPVSEAASVLIMGGGVGGEDWVWGEEGHPCYHPCQLECVSPGLLSFSAVPCQWSKSLHCLCIGIIIDYLNQNFKKGRGGVALRATNQSYWAPANVPPLLPTLGTGHVSPLGVVTLSAQAVTT